MSHNFDLNTLPSAVSSILIDFCDEVITKEEALRLLQPIIKYRKDRGYGNQTIIPVYNWIMIQ